MKDYDVFVKASKGMVRKKLSEIYKDMKEFDEMNKYDLLIEDEVNISSTGSKRINKGKPEMSQLDPRFLMDLADLITKSAAKYGKFNYALGQEYHTPYDSLMRHAHKFWQGEDLDDESGLHHVLHMAANCMILYSSIKKEKKELDTRFDW
jgi:hypothetical protein